MRVQKRWGGLLLAVLAGCPGAAPGALWAAPGACAAAAQTSLPPVSPWKRGPDLPLARAGAATGWVGDRLVVAGGSYWEAGEKRWTDRTDAYDPAARRWEGLPRLPEPVADSGSASDGVSLYAVGGGANGTVSARVLRLRRTGSEWRWERLPDLPRPRTYGAAAMAGGRLCYFGGCDDLADYRNASDETLRLDLDRPERGWQRGAPLPGGPRFLMASAVNDGEVHLFGGCRGTGAAAVSNVDTAARYHPGDDRWRALRPLPRAMRGVTAAALGKDRILLLGGYSASPEDAARYGLAYGFERRTLLWERRRYREAAPLPGAVVDAKASVRDGRLYAVGGEDRARSRTGTLLDTAMESVLRNETSRPVWVCLGDSVTHGVRRSGVTESQTYPRVLEGMLSGQPGAPWVLNAGVGGETTTAAIQRFSSVMKPLPRVDAAVIMYGLNDAALIDPGPRDRTETRVALADYRENLRALVREARRQGAAPVLCTPNPMTRTYAYASRGRYAAAQDINFALEPFAAAARDVAREEKAPLVDVYRFFRCRRDWEKLLPDGIHPNAEGLALLAAEVARVLRPAPNR